MKIFKTHREKEIDTVGMCLQGKICESYETLDVVFGGPIAVGGDGKTDVEWHIEWPCGTVATIYNYKDGKAWCGKEGMNFIDIQDWHIGGHKPYVVVWILNEIRFATLARDTKRALENRFFDAKI